MNTKTFQHQRKKIELLIKKQYSLPTEEEDSTPSKLNREEANILPALLCGAVSNQALLSSSEAMNTEESNFSLLPQAYRPLLEQKQVEEMPISASLLLVDNTASQTQASSLEEEAQDSTQPERDSSRSHSHTEPSNFSLPLLLPAPRRSFLKKDTLQASTQVGLFRKDWKSNFAKSFFYEKKLFSLLPQEREEVLLSSQRKDFFRWHRNPLFPIRPHRRYSKIIFSYIHQSDPIKITTTSFADLVQSSRTDKIREIKHYRYRPEEKKYRLLEEKSPTS